jgi:hypothetical protein
MKFSETVKLLTTRWEQVNEDDTHTYTLTKDETGDKNFSITVDDSGTIIYPKVLAGQKYDKDEDPNKKVLSNLYDKVEHPEEQEPAAKHPEEKSDEPEEPSEEPKQDAKHPEEREPQEPQEPQEPDAELPEPEDSEDEEQEKFENDVKSRDEDLDREIDQELEELDKDPEKRLQKSVDEYRQKHKIANLGANFLEAIFYEFGVEKEHVNRTLDSLVDVTTNKDKAIRQWAKEEIALNRNQAKLDRAQERLDDLKAQKNKYWDSWSLEERAHFMEDYRVQEGLVNKLKKDVAQSQKDVEKLQKKRDEAEKAFTDSIVNASKAIAKEKPDLKDKINKKIDQFKKKISDEALKLKTKLNMQDKLKKKAESLKEKAPERFKDYMKKAGFLKSSD